MKTAISTVQAPKAAGPYSQAIANGDLVFTSGQVPLRPDGTMVTGEIGEQTRQIMQNLSAVLEAGGLSFADVVKTTIYVTDMTVYARINEVYGSFLSAPYPARETIGVAALPLGAQVEISMVAVKA
ncbi:hypothetical protein AUK40_05765 [Candidatus Wirthbacteria bacterium CG2_30_54_11]|uniref:Reactive intermediate/imine deaminase n=1 Tax=Candidatus Wirthbacteria bacterium CG2_30_54_11 TaxID=1817892 RepID=A0A1J5IFD5_9BACT|nr:MAG: hypothetical protein AUK40_05765 [Candidatus Wirthbacteria bacterium CG2_30_54_11]